jgi:uncharacterized membrane protein YczE/cytidylate kinase
MLGEGLLKRTAVFLLGLFIMALGIALSVKANLGTTPISTVPYIYSLGVPLSMGVITIIMHVCFILLQMAILGRKYRLIQLLQLPVAFVFGAFTDVTLYLVSARTLVTNYFLQWGLCLLSSALVAFGVFLQVKAKVVYLAGEGLVLTIAKRFRQEFGRIKVGFDCTLVTIGLVSTFALLHGLHGIREGTIASALLVGTFVRIYSHRLQFVDSLLGSRPGGNETAAVPAGGQGRIVITISREYGSGGHEIGERIAKDLGIAFYDTNLIDLSAAASGFTPEYVRAHEQKLANTLLYELYDQNYAYVDEEMPPLDVLFMVQSKVIRDIAERESCVIVGRCADFVLKNAANLFTVFIHANTDFRMRRIVDEYGIEADCAAKELEKTDRVRANYCKHYTHRNWDAAGNYHLAIDSSALGTEKSARLIIVAAQAMVGS